jgi:hypothetical protein
LFHECDDECSEYRDKDYPIPDRWIIGEYNFNRCPIVYINESVIWWIQVYMRYKNGILPSDGGYYDQTMKFIIIVEMIDLIISQHKRERDDTK